MSPRWNADRELDRRRRELLAQASRHRDRAADLLVDATVAASRDHPILYLASGVAVGAAVVVVAPATARSLRAASSSTLTRTAGAGVRLVVRTLFNIVARGGGARVA